jgi:PadR family transcriptional regulator
LFARVCVALSSALPWRSESRGDHDAALAAKVSSLRAASRTTAAQERAAFVPVTARTLIVHGLGANLEPAAGIRPAHLAREEVIVAYSHKRFMGKAAKSKGQLLQGTLDLLILQSLARGVQHGYSLAEYIQHASEDVLRVEEGALYPALHRLELRGLLAAEWGVSENNRRARYYRLTAVGRRELTAATDQWSRLSGAVWRVLEAS